jgi:co-chaperonin GroES (HSP10)
MKGYKDFMVHIPVKLSDTFKTELGLELHASKKFSQKRLANTIVEVLEVPFEYEGEIESGDTLFIDSTIMLEQTYTLGGEQENINQLDRKTATYKVPLSLIICYKKKGTDNWTLNDINVLLERIPEEIKETGTNKIVYVMSSVPKFKKGLGKVVFNIPEYNLKSGDIVHFKELTMVEVWLENKPLLWLRRRDLMAVQIKQVA